MDLPSADVYLNHFSPNDAHEIETRRNITLLILGVSASASGCCTTLSHQNYAGRPVGYICLYPHRYQNHQAEPISPRYTLLHNFEVSQYALGLGYELITMKAYYVTDYLLWLTFSLSPSIEVCCVLHFNH